MDKCDLHTILRLPTGIFYAGGVKTNVLFFTKGQAGSETGNTTAVWVYDLRTNMPRFGKRTPLSLEHFKPFMAAFGDDPNSHAERTDEGEDGRWRRYTREEIAKRGDNLDLIWLRDDSVERAEDLPDPEDVAAEIIGHLGVATEAMEALVEALTVEADTDGVSP